MSYKSFELPLDFDLFACDIEHNGHGQSQNDRAIINYLIYLFD